MWEAYNDKNKVKGESFKDFMSRNGIKYPQKMRSKLSTYFSSLITPKTNLNTNSLVTITLNSRPHPNPNRLTSSIGTFTHRYRSIPELVGPIIHLYGPSATEFVQERFQNKLVLYDGSRRFPVGSNQPLLVPGKFKNDEFSIRGGMVQQIYVVDVREEDSIFVSYHHDLGKLLFNKNVLY